MEIAEVNIEYEVEKVGKDINFRSNDQESKCKEGYNTGIEEAVALEHDVDGNHNQAGRNLEVNDGSKSNQKRGSYHKFTSQERKKIGKLAAAIGSTTAMRKFQMQNPGLKLAESTVRSFKALYLKETKEKTEIEAKCKRKPRGKYRTYTAQERAAIGKFAFENGNMNAQRTFKDDYPGLSESTIRGFKNTYKLEFEKLNALETQSNANFVEETEEATTYAENMNIVSQKCLEQNSETLTGMIAPLNDKHKEIDSLPRKKHKKSVPPEKKDLQIKETIIRYLQAIAEKDPKMLNYEAVIAITKGVIMTRNRSLLSEFGGDMVIDETWAASFLRQHSILFTDRTLNQRYIGDRIKGVDNEMLDNQANGTIDCLTEAQLTLSSFQERKNQYSSSTILILPCSESNTVIPLAMALDKSGPDI